MRREVALLLPPEEQEARLLFPIFSASNAQKRGNFYFACTIWMLLYWASNFCGRVYGNPRFSKYINLIYYDKFRMTYKGDKLYFNYDQRRSFFCSHKRFIIVYIGIQIYAVTNCISRDTSPKPSLVGSKETAKPSMRASIQPWAAMSVY